MDQLLSKWWVDSHFGSHSLSEINGYLISLLLFAQSSTSKISRGVNSGPVQGFGELFRKVAREHCSTLAIRTIPTRIPEGCGYFRFLFLVVKVSD